MRYYRDLYDAYMCKESFRDIYITADTQEKAATMFDAWVESIPEGTMRDMTTFSFAVPINPKCVYKPYNGKLGDYLTVYLEMHDSRHREESFQNRMKMYYSRLKELNL